MTNAKPAKAPSIMVRFGRGVLGLLVTFLRAVGKFIATFWRLLGALDMALWRGFRLILLTFWDGLVQIALAAGRGARDFTRWLPTRAGRAYSAVSGLVLIFSSLWIIDQIRLAEAADREHVAAGEAPRAPIDEEDPILARMGGRYVHLSNVIVAARMSGELAADETLTVENAFSRGFVDNYIEQRILARAAAKEGVHREGPVITRITAARDRILAAAYLDQKIGEAVSDESVKELFEAQAGVTRLGDEVDARLIVVATRLEALEILGALETGAKFADLAKERSLDRATAPLGGRIGFFTKDMVSPELARAAFNTDPGELAPLYMTDFGWNIVKVLKRRKSEGVAFDAVEANIREFLTLRVIEQTLEELKQEEDVILFAPENIDGSEAAGSVSSSASGGVSDS